jgi:arylsulfatase A
LQKAATITELYDLELDPSETNNLAAKFPVKVKELEKLMDIEHTESEVFPFYTSIK